MTYRIGIDVGGTFTDFLLAFEDDSSKIYKVLSTPHDPSIIKGAQYNRPLLTNWFPG